MAKDFQLRELAISFVAKGLNPTALNPDFLKYSGIIPADWELARPPVYTNQLVQLAFKNGVAIVSQPTRLVLVEAIATKEFDEIEIPKIAKNCIDKLPNMDFQAVGINPRGYITLPSAEEENSFLFGSVLSPGDWQNFGTTPVKAGIQLSYTLERGQLNLAINDANLRLPEDETVPATVFSGNFNYEVSGETPAERVASLSEILEGWQKDLESYQALICDKFLGQEVLTDPFATTA
jgi:hypothetical protein